VGSDGGRFTLRSIGRDVFAGSLGAAAGAAGYYGSKMILPVEHDTRWTGYAAHGLLGTVAATGAGWASRMAGFRLPVGTMIAGSWATVAFRVMPNTLFKGARRPAQPIVPPSPAAAQAGLAGIEGNLPLGMDFDVSGLLGAPAQTYGKPTPYDLGSPVQRYVKPVPYDLGQHIQPARSLPAATQPLQGPQDVPETGMAELLTTRAAPSWKTPLW